MNFSDQDTVLDLAEPGEILRRIGSRVRVRRAATGLTQADLAQRSGVSRMTVVRLEAGENVGTEALIRIAGALRALAEVIAMFPPPERTRSVEKILSEQIVPKRVRSKSPRPRTP
jgi:transcriptional regulator with XRE-family HTH domain